MYGLLPSWIKSAAVVAGLVMTPLAALAEPVSCPGDDACNGNSYSASYTQVDSDTWRVQVDVHVLGSYTGTLGSDMLSALAIKNMTGSTITNASLFSAPGGGDPFSFYAGELSNGGAVCGNDPSPGTKMCAWAGDGKGIVLDLGDTLSFVFQFDAESIGSGLHLKYQYLSWDDKKSEWKKIGSLGSFDIPLLERCTNGDCDPPDPCTNGDCGNVPTPASTALLGIGLVGLALARRRRRAAQ